MDGNADEDSYKCDACRRCRRGRKCHNIPPDKKPFDDNDWSRSNWRVGNHKARRGIRKDLRVLKAQSHRLDLVREKNRINGEKLDAIIDEPNEHEDVQAIDGTQTTVGTQVNNTSDGTGGKHIQTDSEAPVRKKTIVGIKPGPIRVLEHGLRVLERNVQVHGEEIDELGRINTTVTERGVGDIQSEMVGPGREEMRMEIEEVKIEEDEEVKIEEEKEAKIEQEVDVRIEGEKAVVESQGAWEWFIMTLAESVIDTLMVELLGHAFSSGRAPLWHKLLWQGFIHFLVLLLRMELSRSRRLEEELKIVREELKRLKEEKRN